jgi:hypothetical protein
MHEHDSTDPIPASSEFAAREQAFRTQAAELDAIQNRLSNARLITGALAIAALIWFVAARDWLPLVVAGIALIVLTALVVRHRAARARFRRAEILADINQEATWRLERNWTDLPLSHEFEPDPGHPYANDLDIFGHGSLFHLLDTAATQMGEATLRQWLLGPAPAGEARSRQDAAGELASALVWRQDLELLGRLASDQRLDPDAFLAWAEGDRALAGKRYLVWLARAGFAATIVTVSLVLLGILDAIALAVPIVANLLIGLLARGIAGDRIEAAYSQHQVLRGYRDILAHLDTSQFGSPMLATLLEDLGRSSAPAHHQVRRLERIISFIVPRSSLSHLPLQSLTSWDIHVLDSLEGWQQDNGREVRNWFRVIGEFEALSALAGLAYANPNWAFASLDLKAERIEGSDLGHPLIPDVERVVNDVTVGPPGTFLLVTGSNMSGKSTLLRSIGVNIVLAQAGGPSCASTFSLPPVELWTSVRVTDSLEQGVSFYMAELLRLRAIYEASRETSGSERQFCFLLDEILQGTNSAERQVAARHIIAELVRLGAIGAVSTHDLDLASAGELTGMGVPVHFADDVVQREDGPEMSFDYRLRPGLATSTNALKLMELVGFTMPSGNGSVAQDEPSRSR